MKIDMELFNDETLNSLAHIMIYILAIYGLICFIFDNNEKSS